MKKFVLLLILFNLLVVSCNNSEDTPIPTLAAAAEIQQIDDTNNGNTDSGASSEPVVEAADTAVAATATPTEPMAAVVNGQPIFLADYEAELSRYEKGQAELGIETPDPNYRQIVLDALIEKSLIEQAAQEQGIVVSDEIGRAHV